MTEQLAISVTGPEPNAGPHSDWEEYPEWIVCLMDEDGEPVGKIYYCRSYDKASDLGEKMARDRNIELVNEASPWW